MSENDKQVLWVTAHNFSPEEAQEIVETIDETFNDAGIDSPVILTNEQLGFVTKEDLEEQREQIDLVLDELEEDESPLP